ncbi:MAG: hypothetical protein QG670_1608 [Thermoproteota archaeon]|nr:hypothetical protein [Thermoproteota archaeon]
MRLCPEVCSLKLKRLFLVEIASIIIIIVSVMFFIKMTPYLASTEPDMSIGVYNQRVFTEDTLTLESGQMASTEFNYSTFDPAILVIDLMFQSWQTPGDLSVYCNGILIATIRAIPGNPTVRLTSISVSGWDWVQPPSVNSLAYSNQISFVSEPNSGFEGTFTYQIGIRGSRG